MDDTRFVRHLKQRTYKPRCPFEQSPLRSLFAYIFKTLGWKTEGQLPSNIHQYVLVVAPHTSNWDFMVGLGARASLNFEPKYIAKKELFFWPVGWIFKKLGGYPVDRKGHHDIVLQMADIFDKDAHFVLTITPEGTRKHNAAWKTGFFYLAQKADVPIVPIAFDYPNKRVVVGPAMQAKGDVHDFVNTLKKWFFPYKGKHPDLGILPDEVI